MFTAGPSDVLAGPRVLAGYAMLPGSLAILVSCCGIVVNRIVVKPPVLDQSVTFLAIGGGIVLGLWGVKEIYRPTLRRTPKWLAEEFESDPVLKEFLYGSRLNGG
jgi:hypothetical protein